MTGNLKKENRKLNTKKALIYEALVIRISRKRIESENNNFDVIAHGMRISRKRIERRPKVLRKRKLLRGMGISRKRIERPASIASSTFLSSSSGNLKKENRKMKE